MITFIHLFLPRNPHKYCWMMNSSRPCSAALPCTLWCLKLPEKKLIGRVIAKDVYILVTYEVGQEF